MFTTHTETLTELKVTVRKGAVEIKHPSGLMQTLDAKKISALYDAELEELGLIEANLRVYEGYLRDI